MIPGTHHLTIRRGVAFHIRFVAKAGGQVVDLTGWTAAAHVRAAADGAQIADLAPEVTDDDEGIIDIILTAAQTTALPAGSYFWDLLLTPPDGEPTGPYAAGNCKISNTITQL